MRVSDVIKSKGSSAVMTIAPEATIEELLEQLAEHNIGAMVVSADGSSITGIVSERDIVRKLRGEESPARLTVSSIMTAQVLTCSPDDSFEDLMKLMTENRVRHVPVVEDGAAVGVVSIGDAVKYRMAQLEFERDQLNQYVARG